MAFGYKGPMPTNIVEDDHVDVELALEDLLDGLARVGLLLELLADLVAQFHLFWGLAKSKAATLALLGKVLEVVVVGADVLVELVLLEPQLLQGLFEEGLLHVQVILFVADLEPRGDLRVRPSLCSYQNGLRGLHDIVHFPELDLEVRVHLLLVVDLVVDDFLVSPTISC